MSKKIVACAFIALIIIFVILVFFRSTEGPVVEDAFVSSRVLNIVARNDGLVGDLHLARGQHIRAGDTMVYVGATANRLRLQMAVEKLKAVINDELKLCKSHSILKSEVRRAEQKLMLAQSEFDRSENLMQQKFISAQALERKRSDVMDAAASLEIALDELDKSSTTNRVPLLDRPTVKQLMNEVQAAYYALLESRVSAPYEGYVYDIRSYPGKFVEKGEALFTLVSNEGQLVEANVLESEVSQIEPGLEVRIKSDVRRDREIHGVVESIVPSVAASFSVIPRNNIDSNWIKTSQRIPVLIRMTDEVALPVGSSVKVIFLKNAPVHDLVAPHATRTRNVENTDWRDDYRQYMKGVLGSAMRTAGRESSCVGG